MDQAYDAVGVAALGARYSAVGQVHDLFDQIPDALLGRRGVDHGTWGSQVGGRGSVQARELWLGEYCSQKTNKAFDCTVLIHVSAPPIVILTARWLI